MLLIQSFNFVPKRKHFKGVCKVAPKICLLDYQGLQQWCTCMYLADGLAPADLEIVPTVDEDRIVSSLKTVLYAYIFSVD
jgi:hypothetical protein